MAKYTHLPFEEWVLDRNALSQEEEQALQEHLQHCPSCKEFEESLQEMESRLKAQTMLSPEPGFTQRWQARLAHERERNQMRQTYAFLAVTTGGAALLMLAMGILLIPVLRSPYPYLLALAYQLTLVVAFINGAVEVVASLIGAVLRVVPPIAWLGLFGVTSFFVVLWLAAFRLYIYPARIKT